MSTKLIKMIIAAVVEVQEKINSEFLSYVCFCNSWSVICDVLND